MKKVLLFASLGILLAGFAPDSPTKKVLPHRWVLVRNTLRDDRDIEKVRAIAQTAAEHGLTGIVFGSPLDAIDRQPPGFQRRLRAVRDICRGFKIDLIPSLMIPGYGQGILEHDQNLAEGLPVRDALFLAKQGRASLVPDPTVGVKNGGFEEMTTSALPSFEVSAPIGTQAVPDRSDFQEGRASLRLQNFGTQPEETIRLGQWATVKPSRCYRLSCSVKARNLRPSDPFGESGFQLEVLGGDERRPLQYENPVLGPNDDWHQVAVAFNSWNYDKVLISPVVRGGGKGVIWIDDLKLEEIALVNVLRRPGTPLVVKGEKNGTVYEEGRDFAPVSDPLMDFHFEHAGPTIQILPGGRIEEGDRLRVSFYHSVFIYNDQVPICMSEAKPYEIWEDQVALVESILGPRYYFLNADEHRALGTCQACKESGKTLGQIQADCVTRQYRMIKAANPKAEIFVWSDMFDPNHNAGTDRKYYYLTDGSFAGSWNYIPKDLNIVCWYFERREASLKHFSSLGFKTMAGAYYDADNLDNPKAWLETMDRTAGAVGILYTTWLDKYGLLGPFGDLVSRR